MLDIESSTTHHQPQLSAEPGLKPCYGWVKGEAITELPQDLYIPPEALQVVLEIFEGPLDLLLYLIRKHNLDILNIPVAEVTRQYIKYIELMQAFRLELAAEYLEMAALLAEIKSRLLLPKNPELEEDPEADPRAELVRRLQEYERFKAAAETMEKMPRWDRDLAPVAVQLPQWHAEKNHPEVAMEALVFAFQAVLSRMDLKEVHKIQREVLSVREKMSRILAELETEQFRDFVLFFDLEEGRLGVVVTFLAILELAKEYLVELVQNQAFGPIYLRAIAREED